MRKLKITKFAEVKRQEYTDVIFERLTFLAALEDGTIVQDSRIVKTGMPLNLDLKYAYIWKSKARGKEGIRIVLSWANKSSLPHWDKKVHSIPYQPVAPEEAMKYFQKDLRVEDPSGNPFAPLRAQGSYQQSHPPQS